MKTLYIQNEKILNIGGESVESIIRDVVSAKEKESSSAFPNSPKIMVVGCGGAGCNTVNRLARMGIEGAELVAINTDRQHLEIIHDSIEKLLIGEQLTRGLGAGGYPEVGLKAAESSRKEIEKMLEGVDLLFLTAGMGGGTGTGSAPVVAEIAKEQGAIVISMVNYPFRVERARLSKADEGIERLRKVADTVVVIDNNRLVDIAHNLSMEQAFMLADSIVANAVKGITETITTPSLINLDFADIKAIMTDGGVSVISVGEAAGPERTKKVVEKTLKNSLLDVDYTGAKGALIHITGGNDLTVGEANEIAEMITDAVDPSAQVVLGARLDPAYEGKVQVIAIMTGVTSPHIKGPAKKAAGDHEQEELGITIL